MGLTLQKGQSHDNEITRVRSNHRQGHYHSQEHVLTEGAASLLRYSRVIASTGSRDAATPARSISLASWLAHRLENALIIAVDLNLQSLAFRLREPTLGTNIRLLVVAEERVLLVVGIGMSLALLRIFLTLTTIGSNMVTIGFLREVLSA